MKAQEIQYDALEKQAETEAKSAPYKKYLIGLTILQLYTLYKLN